MEGKIKSLLLKWKASKKAKVFAIAGCCILLVAVGVGIVVTANFQKPPTAAAGEQQKDVKQTFSTTSASEEPATTVPVTNKTDPASEPAETTKKVTEKATSQTTTKKSSTSSGASSSTPKPNTGSSNQKPVTATQAQSSQWTQAEVDALVSEIKAYAQSKGFAINPNKGKVGTTWPNPIHAGKDKSKTKADLKETVDFFCGLAIEELGSVTGSINVFAEKYTDSNGLPQWELYVVR